MTRPRATTSPVDDLGATIAELKARATALENVAHLHNAGSPCDCDNLVRRSGDTMTGNLVMSGAEIYSPAIGTSAASDFLIKRGGVTEAKVTSTGIVTEGIGTDTASGFELRSNSVARATLTSGGVVAIGPTSVADSNPTSQLQVRRDTVGGRGGEIALVNYATNTVGNSAALNFGVDASTFDNNNGNAQVRATLQNASNGATELGLYNWNGSSFVRSVYIDQNARARLGRTDYWAATDQMVGTGRQLTQNFTQSSGSASAAPNVELTIYNQNVDTLTVAPSALVVAFGVSCFLNGAGTIKLRIVVGGVGTRDFSFFTNEGSSHKQFFVMNGFSGLPLSATTNIRCGIYSTTHTISVDSNDAFTLSVWAP